MGARDRRHYTGSYQARSRAVRDAANADPSTTCWLCGLTLAQFKAKHPDRKATWEADHVIPGQPLSPLRAAHSWCNQSRGGSTGAARRGLNTSRRWY